jgi:hypothetical protein
MALEMAFHNPHGRGYNERIRREIELYRQWLSDGKAVLIFPLLHGPRGGEHEMELMAAMALIVRQPGQAFYVARSYFRSTPQWAEWPQRLGPPQEDYRFIGPSQLERRFTNGTLRVDLLRGATNVTK